MKTELTDSPRRYCVADVMSTLEFLGSGDSVLPPSPWHKDSSWIEGTPGSDSRILLTDPNDKYFQQLNNKANSIF